MRSIEWNPLKDGPAKRYGTVVEWDRIVPARLAEPLFWMESSRVAVCDLFEPDVSHDEACAVFGVMAVCSQHVYRVLTQHPDRASAWIARLERRAFMLADVVGAAQRIMGDDVFRREPFITWWPNQEAPRSMPPLDALHWPLPNVEIVSSMEAPYASD